MNILQKIVYVKDGPSELIPNTISIMEASDLMKEGGYILIGEIPLHIALDADQYDVVIMSTILGSVEIKDMKNVMSISHDDVTLALALLTTGHGKIQVVTDNAQGVSLFGTLYSIGSARGVDVSLIDLRLRIVHEPLDDQALIVSYVDHSDVSYPEGATVITSFDRMLNAERGVMSLVPSPIEWNIWHRPDNSLPEITTDRRTIENLIDSEYPGIADLPEWNGLRIRDALVDLALDGSDLSGVFFTMILMSNELSFRDALELWNNLTGRVGDNSNISSVDYTTIVCRLDQNGQIVCEEDFVRIPESASRWVCEVNPDSDGQLRCRLVSSADQLEGLEGELTMMTPISTAALTPVHLTPRSLIEKDMTIFIPLIKQLTEHTKLSRDDLINLWNQYVADSKYQKSFAIRRFVSPTTHLPLFNSYDLMTNIPLDLDENFVDLFEQQNNNQIFDGGQTLLRYKFRDSVYENMNVILMTLLDSPANGIYRYTSSFSLVNENTLVSGLEALNNTIGPDVESISARLTHV